MGLDHPIRTPRRIEEFTQVVVVEEEEEEEEWNRSCL